MMKYVLVVLMFLTVCSVQAAGDYRWIFIDDNIQTSKSPFSIFDAAVAGLRTAYNAREVGVDTTFYLVISTTGFVYMFDSKLYFFAVGKGNAFPFNALKPQLKNACRHQNEIKRAKNSVKVGAFEEYYEVYITDYDYANSFEVYTVQGEAGNIDEKLQKKAKKTKNRELNDSEEVLTSNHKIDSYELEKVNYNEISGENEKYAASTIRNALLATWIFVPKTKKVYEATKGGVRAIALISESVRFDVVWVSIPELKNDFSWDECIAGIVRNYDKINRYTSNQEAIKKEPENKNKNIRKSKNQVVKAEGELNPSRKRSFIEIPVETTDAYFKEMEPDLLKTYSRLIARVNHNGGNK